MKLAASTRESRNLQDELSEAFRIKAQLAELHQAEVAKNIEAEKQVKFFQGSVAAAFAERDQSLLEAEKAKEKEELMSQKFIPMQTRLEELTSDLLQQRRRNDELLLDLAKWEQQSENLKKVVNKFFEIRQQSSEGSLETTWDEKCECLLHDPLEVWNYNDPSTSDYISALEEELETVRKSVGDLRSKMQMIRFNQVVMSGILELHKFHSQHRLEILDLLADEKSKLKLMVDMIEEHIKGSELTKQNVMVSGVLTSSDQTECRDVHVSTVTDTSSASTRNDSTSKVVVAPNQDNEASEVLKQALQEKVQTLLLLSQQDERQLLERNVNGALQKKIEELQRNLLQVAHEKVKALMELAQLKQEHQQLKEKLADEARQGNSLAEKKHTNQERDAGIKSVLKKTYLRRWLGTLDSTGRSEVDTHSNSHGDLSGRKSNSMDVARMKIENATLKESLESMEHLVSSTHRLRLALTRIRESMAEESTEPCSSGALDGILSEAKLVKTALGSSLPISWSAEVDDASSSPRFSNEPSSNSGGTTDEKMDFVSAAGFEMVELLILAAQALKETSSKCS
ncbi:unnamed protein product [Linum tenue]|uniref:Uncharacterized protein n=1 Tax=Linum tenue TaxID=586396 RepID=A0AAV0GPI5_9ROSI|nr:unnamed protein product [Linum tenue]